MEQGPGAGNVVSGGSVAGPLIQAHSIGQLVMGPVAEAARGEEDAWAGRARSSSVWQHVPSSRGVGEYRELAASVAGRLASLRDEAEGSLREDPWQEPEFATRFADRVEWLLGEPGETPGLDLYPAEAALLILTPYLYRVHALRTAVRRLAVQPWKLDPQEAAPHGSERAGFEAFTDGYGLLVQRALLRRESEAAIGWWLFHRWLVQGYSGEDPVAELLEALGEPATALGEALDPRRLSRLLHGLRRGPDVCNPEYLDTLLADDRLRGPGHQRVRDQRLVLLTALAYTVSVEMTALPDIVAEHLGIPHAVDLAELRSALEGSSWGGSAELPVLRAECAHEAVIEGLRAYVVRADETLHAVSRTARERVNQPMPVLPSRLSADGVCPSDGAFMGWASFRLDERRIRDLLMGVQLYKDRDLAVRELYQNALDACRYRRARTEYLDRTHTAASYTYEGEIVFEQAVDEDGREYVECRDNGIGMGEAELRGVFSNAGARFAEQPDFKEERAQWARLDPPVTLYPNSRFGIGVLSYFMLADEIRVTTCRMGMDGTPGPVLEASIFGPGHLFRIVRVAERGSEPGSVVRLYLRDHKEELDGEDGAAWSSPHVLQRLLGIAEFRTTARHGSESAEWVPRVLIDRRQPRGERFGIDATGGQLPWPDAPAGAQVIWCGDGGGLLVDGLVVQPTVRGGVFSSEGSGLSGVVVNLSGAFSPERLSADRSQVLDDLRGTVHDILRDAVGHLVSAGNGPLSFSWLCGVASKSRVLADLVTGECIGGGTRFRDMPVKANAARIGCLPADRSLLQGAHGRPQAQLPDYLYLWRLLAHGLPGALAELTALCPDLDAFDTVLPALPSDEALLESRVGIKGAYDGDPLDVVAVAADLMRTPRDTALRAARLRLIDLPPDVFPDRPVRPAQVIAVVGEMERSPGFRGTRDITVSGLVSQATEARVSVTAVVSDLRRAGTEVPEAVYSTAVKVARDEVLSSYLFQFEPDWFSPEARVHPGQLVSTAEQLGVGIADLRERLTRCGLCTEWTDLPPSPTTELLQLLSEDLDERPPWLSYALPVPPGHILLASHRWLITPAEAMDVYVRLGFTTTPIPEVVDARDRLLFTGQRHESDLFGSAVPPMRPGRPVAYKHLFQAARTFSLPYLIARLEEYGIRVPLRAPDPMTDLDHELFTADGALSWDGVTTHDVMPFARLIHAAQDLLMHPREIAARLAAHGVESSCSDLPQGLSLASAQQLLMESPNRRLSISQEMDFQSLVRKAQSMHIPIHQAHDWLTQLGVPTCDPAESIRAALPLIPR